MRQKETKTIFAWIALITVIIWSLPRHLLATDYTSPNFIVKDPVITGGAQTSNSGTFTVGQSFGQPAIGKSTSGNFQLLSGFQYYFQVNANTLTATAGSGQVSLSWTVPTTFLGISVSSYEVGTGTTSGSYTFEDVGNVTSFIKTGLTNGTPYFFKIKAKSAGGLFLVFSNEATATPSAGAGGGAGGGGGSYVPATNATFNGYAYPSSVVTILRDGVMLTTALTDNAGKFNLTIAGLTTGKHNFAFYATDPFGNQSSLRSIIVEVTNIQPITVPDFILSPTLTTSLSTVKIGENIAFSGFSEPNSQITFILNDDSSKTYTATANSSGQFTYTLNTDGLSKGDYSITATSKFLNLTSNLSKSLTFKVGDETIIVSPPTTPGGGITKCGDFNGDGRIDLVDFSILIYWFDKTNPPARVDCNNDNIVDLIDFSILMYNWTG